MKDYEVGVFVRYLPKNEIGLIGATSDIGAYCWYHIGGTRALTGFDLIAPISSEEAMESRFNNEYAKASLFERQARIFSGEDVSDLIDRDDIRESIYNKFAKRGGI